MSGFDFNNSRFNLQNSLGFNGVNNKVDTNKIPAAFNNSTFTQDIDKDKSLGFSGVNQGLDIASKIGSLALGFQQYKLAKDTFNQNKLNQNRAYEANKTKFNNSVNRTRAINDFYGVLTTQKTI